MRSLVLLHHESSIVQGKKPEAKLSCLAVRPEEIALTSSRGETVYVASERQLPDGGVEIQIFVGNSDSPEADTVCFLSVKSELERETLKSQNAT